MHWCFVFLISCIKRDMNSIIFAILLLFRTVNVNYMISHFIRTWYIINEQFPFCFFLYEAASTIKTTETKTYHIAILLSITVSFFLRWIHPKKKMFIILSALMINIVTLFFVISLLLLLLSSALYKLRLFTCTMPRAPLSCRAVCIATTVIDI